MCWLHLLFLFIDQFPRHNYIKEIWYDEMCPDDCRGCKKSHTVILCIIPILLTLSLSLSNIQYSLNPGVTLSSFRSNIVWPQYPIILGVVRTWPHFLPLIINHSSKHYAFLRGEYYLSKLIAQSSENTINSYLQAVYTCHMITTATPLFNEHLWR